ncbi:Thioredoxin-like fold [Lasallia pustulata]|uniref:Thioredoxin-like fold n=1 Tax=Lasallia pustulata TaxID=136370 RepID=A0A1W5CW87_9LECA|nr:Thioredoxin-like fold [Lasallia pustulata]
MVYQSQIAFTLDTISLKEFRSSSPHSNAVSFTIKYLPYQLYPDASKEGEDKYEWYKKTRYGDSEEKMKMYTTLMSAYGFSVGIDYRFDGTVANTLDAHRLIQHYQEKGPEVADKIVNSLYHQYFESAQHPSSTSTLLTAAIAAGIPDADAKAFIEDEYEGLQEVKMLIREQAGNGIDSVPYVVVEGRRRDFTLEGAKEVVDYLKTLEQVAKESG